MVTQYEICIHRPKGEKYENKMETKFSMYTQKFV